MRTIHGKAEQKGWNQPTLRNAAHMLQGACTRLSTHTFKRHCQKKLSQLLLSVQGPHKTRGIASATRVCAQQSKQRCLPEGNATRHRHTQHSKSCSPHCSVHATETHAHTLQLDLPCGDRLHILAACAVSSDRQAAASPAAAKDAAAGAGCVDGLLWCAVLGGEDEGEHQADDIEASTHTAGGKDRRPAAEHTRISACAQVSVCERAWSVPARSQACAGSQAAVSDTLAAKQATLTLAQR